MTDEYRLVKDDGNTVTVIEEDANGDISGVLDSLSTDRIDSVEVVDADDDLDAILSSLSSATMVWFSEDAAHQISNPTLPQTVVFDGAPVTIEKAENGDLLTYNSEFEIRTQITFDGRSDEGLTGRGLVPTTDGLNWLGFHRCVFSNFSDYAVVLDEPEHWWFDRCYWVSLDTYAIRETDSGVDVPRYGGYTSCEINDCTGGIDSDSGSRFVTYDVRVQLSTEAAFNYTGGYLDNVDFAGNVTNNDGPGILVDGCDVREVSVSGNIISNGKSPDAGLTTPVGQIHAESVPNDAFITQTGGSIGPGTDVDASQAIIQDVGNNVLFGSYGGKPAGGELHGTWADLRLGREWQGVDLSNAADYLVAHTRKAGGADRPSLTTKGGGGPQLGDTAGEGPTVVGADGNVYEIFVDSNGDLQNSQV
jgi:hypothetical protein